MRTARHLMALTCLVAGTLSLVIAFDKLCFVDPGAAVPHGVVVASVFLGLGLWAIGTHLPGRPTPHEARGPSSPIDPAP